MMDQHRADALSCSTQRLLDDLPDGIAYLILKGTSRGAAPTTPQVKEWTIEACNSAFASILDADCERMRGLPAIEAFGAALALVTGDSWDALLAQAASCGETLYAEARSARGARWYQAAIRADGGGGLFTSWRDITEPKSAYLALEASEHTFRMLIDRSREAFIVAQGDVLKYANPSALELTGYSREELMQKPFWEMILPESRAEAEYEIARLWQGQRRLDRLPIAIATRDGSVKWVEVSGARVEWEGCPAMLTMGVDITRRKLAEEQLAKFKEVADKAMFGLAIADMDGNLIYINQSFADAHGYGLEELLGSPLGLLYTGSQERQMAELKHELLATGGFVGREIWHKHRSGRTYPMLMTGSLLRDRDGKPDCMVFSALDISDQKRHQDQLRYFGFHDQLTGVYNRAYLDEELKRLASGRRHPVSIISADLNGLKLVNDTMGHAAGDELLITVAGLIQSALRSSDVVARTGGDEFAVVLPSTPEEAATEVAHRIALAVERHSEQAGKWPVSLSIGVATSLTPETSLARTAQLADSRMYQDKVTRRAGQLGRTAGALLTALARQTGLPAGYAQDLAGTAQKVGSRLGLSAQQLSDLALLVQFHDLGKVATSGNNLRKRRAAGVGSPETEAETARLHPEIGFRLASSIPELVGIADLILKHRERWDTMGYPLGIGGEDIPLVARVFAVAQAYAALIHGWPEGEPMARADAVAEVSSHAGTRYDPQVVAALVALAG